MKPEVLQARWKQLRDEVKMRWSGLTDAEIDAVDGESEKLTALLQRRFGYAKDHADREVSAWIQNLC